MSTLIILMFNVNSKIFVVSGGGGDGEKVQKSP